MATATRPADASRATARRRAGAARKTVAIRAHAGQRAGRGDADLRRERLQRRADRPDRRARGVNKQLIYYYFGSKEQALRRGARRRLFGAALRRGRPPSRRPRSGRGHPRARPVQLALSRRASRPDQPGAHREPAQGEVPQAVAQADRPQLAADRRDLGLLRRGARAASSAPTPIRSTSTSPSRRSASTISPTNGPWR